MMLRAYLNALRRELVGFLMGSTPLAIIGGVEHYRGQSIAWSLYGAALLCGFFVASYRVWAKEKQRADRANTEPALQLSFDPSDTTAVDDFDEHVDDPEEGEYYVPRRLFRVLLQNVGAQPARDVRVAVDSVDPLPDYSFGHPLAFMSGKEGGIVLHPGGKAWVLVASVTRHKIPYLTFLFADESWRCARRAKNMLFTLRAEGGREAVYGRYLITFDAKGDASMRSAE